MAYVPCLIKDILHQGNEEDQVCAWIKELVGQDLEPATMHDTLKSGVILCELVS